MSKYLIILLFFCTAQVHAQNDSITMLYNTEWKLDHCAFGNDTLILLPCKYPNDTTISAEKLKYLQEEYFLTNKIAFDETGDMRWESNNNYTRMTYRNVLTEFKFHQGLVQLVVHRDDINGNRSKTWEYTYRVLEWNKNRIVLCLKM